MSEVQLSRGLEWPRALASLVSLTGGTFMPSDCDAGQDNDLAYLIHRCVPPLPTEALRTESINARKAARDMIARAGLNPRTADTNVHDAHPIASLWSFHLNHGNRDWHVVGRFAMNALDASEVSCNELGLDSRVEYHVYDFWAAEYLGVVRDRVSFEDLPAGHCQVLAFVAACDHPQLIATTRHVSMDAISVRDQRWNADYGTLMFDLALVPGSVESYFVHTPAPWRFVDLDGAGCTFRAEVHALVNITVVAQHTDAHLLLKYVK